MVMSYGRGLRRKNVGDSSQGCKNLFLHGELEEVIFMEKLYA